MGARSRDARAPTEAPDVFSDRLLLARQRPIALDRMVEWFRGRCQRRSEGTVHEGQYPVPCQEILEISARIVNRNRPEGTVLRGLSPCLHSMKGQSEKDSPQLRRLTRLARQALLVRSTTRPVQTRRHPSDHRRHPSCRHHEIRRGSGPISARVQRGSPTHAQAHGRRAGAAQDFCPHRVRPA